MEMTPYEGQLDGILDRLIDDQARRKRNNERYANDPEYRERVKARARRWNAVNREKKRRNDEKWAKKHGAAAAKRYRQRKKETHA